MMDASLGGQSAPNTTRAVHPFFIGWNMVATSAKEARELGFKFYYTGKPCPKGHDAERSARDGKCRECNRIACQNRFFRKRDKTPGAWDEYWEKLHTVQENKYKASLSRTRSQAERNLKKAARESGEKCYKSGRICPKGHIGMRYVSGSGCVKCLEIFSASDQKKAYDKIYYRENADRIRLRRADYVRENWEWIYERSKTWQRMNPEKVKATKQSYKHRRRDQESEGMTGAELQRWKEQQEKKCFWCDVDCSDNYHVDHIYPPF